MGHTLKYLGDKLTANILDYMPLNLLPLLTLLKQKVQACIKLPLSSHNSLFSTAFTHMGTENLL